VSSFGNSGLFSDLFGHGATDVGDLAWLQAMLDTEAALARALERAGLAAAGAGAEVTAAARADRFDPAELGRQATRTGNPVPALVRALTSMLPDQAAGAVHRGATSQDIMDTAAMLVARRALDGVLADLAGAATAAANLAEAQAGTIMIGRTLLQQAVPVTFGLVAAGWLTAIDEASSWLHRVRADRLAVQFGGAAGTLAPLGEAGPEVVALLAEELGLRRPVLPWHTDRLRIIELASALAGACAAVGKVARDVTLLAQSEVAEVTEGPAAASQSGEVRQGGSSAMPHKRNPVASVVILGCTRRAPGLLATLVAAGEQELQRAAGAWHAEWEPLADLLGLTGSASRWTAELLAGLQVDADRMRANLDAAGGFPMAARVAAMLVPVLGPVAAHEAVAEASAAAAAAGLPLRDALLDSPELARGLAGPGPGQRPLDAVLSAEQLDAALDPAGYLGASRRFVADALAAHRQHAARYAAPARDDGRKVSR
jgi:3-carboxy-cis,cis-muconate cycloisomerase